MRAIFSVLGLLLVVAVIGMLAKKQLGSATPASAPPTESGVAAPAGTPRQQLDQFKQGLDATLQQAPRTVPDDTK